MTHLTFPMQHDDPREQLSAMLDGALGADQARFLLRRLQHDTDLGGRWQRWQAYGDAMRGNAHAVPADFSQRVMAAIGAVPAPAAPRGKPLWRRLVTAALAASVALAALFASRLQPGTHPGAAPPSWLVAAKSTAPAAPVQPQAPATQEAAALGAAVAVASVPRRYAARDVRRSRGQWQRAALRQSPTRAAEPATVLASASVPAKAAVAAASPFSLPEPEARPWPKSQLPSAAGAFTVGYGDAAASSPFALRARDLPAQPDAAP